MTSAPPSDADEQARQDRLLLLRWSLASNPALPGDVFDRLIAVGDAQVWWELASRDDLDDDRIRALVGCENGSVTWCLLQRGALAPQKIDRFDKQLVISTLDLGPVREDWVWKVAADPDPAVRGALGSTTHLPADVVAALADDPEPAVVAGAALAPQLTEPLAARLAAHPHVTVRRALASNEHVPGHILAALAGRVPSAPQSCPVCDGSGDWLAQHWTCDGTHGDAMDDLDCALAQNPATPAAAVSRFAGHGSVHVRGRLAARADLPQRVYRILARDPALAVRAELADNPAIGEEAIRVLAADPGVDVRRNLAHHPALPLDVLADLAGTAKLGRVPLPRIVSATPGEVAELAASGDAAVRMLLAARPDLPRRTVDRLAADGDAKVLKSVAANPALSPAQLRAMVAAHGPRVAAGVAANPSCPPDLLTDLARQVPPVRQALVHIARRPDAPAEALAACLGDRRARQVAARHPALPADTIAALLADAEVEVAAAAAGNPSLPAAAMRDLANAV